MSAETTTERFENSAATWQEHPARPAELPPVLQPSYRQLGFWDRLRSFGARTQARRRLAEENYALMRDPSRGLPVADASQVRAFLGKLIAKRRVLAVGLVTFNILAAVAGLLVPRYLGTMVDAATNSPGTFNRQLPRMVLTVALFVIAQTVLSFSARRMSSMFGQGMLAEAREYVMRTVLKLPLSKVESASTGDLVTRVTRDVSSMAASVRWALPNFILESITVCLTVAALLVNSVLLTIPLLVCGVFFALAARRYIQRANKGYIAEGSAYSRVNTTLTETIEGARTVEALNLQAQRIQATEDDLEAAGQAERYTITLRNELFLVTGFAYRLPLIAVLLIGGWGYFNGVVSLGEITAASLYLQQVTSPLGRLVQTLNMMQEGVASTARLLGIATVPPDRQVSGLTPADEHLVGKDLRFAYRPGHDVLHGIDIDLRPGERLAIVGPSGSGKSTLGRLLAGINGPRTGVVEVGGVDIMGLPLDQLRTAVALVTQEHHVFVGSIRDNIILARENTATDEQVWDALATVEASDWVERLPDGLATKVGSANLPLTPAQAQQIALARLVIADPHTLVLDEATSLIDPHTARHVEGSMSALLTDRTVVAIAHRLHTAHDADRIAVVIDGKIAELGSHHELLGLDGEYAALWRAWTS